MIVLFIVSGTVTSAQALWESWGEARGVSAQLLWEHGALSRAQQEKVMFLLDVFISMVCCTKVKPFNRVIFSAIVT